MVILSNSTRQLKLYMLTKLLPLIFSIICLVPQSKSQPVSNSWAEVQKNGHGTLVVAYSENSPFIYKNNQGKLAGIEYDFLQELIMFVSTNYNVKLELVWEHLPNFDTLLDTLKWSSRPMLGIASISTLKERKKDFKISKPYMPDIEVIISSGAFGSVSSLGEFAKLVKENRAVTVTNSTFERNILELKKDFFQDINIKYVPHVDLLIESVSSTDNSWGYISLPNYLANYKKGKNITRQRFFMVENPGLSIATPLTSDWDSVINEFIESPEFKPFLNLTIEKHLGNVFNKVVAQITNQSSDLTGDITASREVGVLTLERELQDLKLKKSELEISKKNLFIYLSIIGILLALVVLFGVFRLMRLKAKTNESLFEKNKQIEQQILELNSLNIEKNELIGIVAHDLKNPLTSAMSVAELFSDEEITEDQKEYVGLIQRSLNRMNGLVAKILEIKVLESKSLKVNFVNIELRTVVERVISALKIQSDNKAIKIIANLDNSTARVDKSLLEQILDNLLSNAIKFSRKNSTIRIRLISDQDIIRFEVEDHGPGISKKEQTMLFKKFQKLSARPTAGENSTGLGLSIVKKYVDAMNGKTWCESELGKGATFIVELNKS